MCAARRIRNPSKLLRGSLEGFLFLYVFGDSADTALTIS